jgi:hypothetical protein
MLGFPGDDVVVCSFSIHLAQLLAAAFFAILFLQSGIDKIVDRRGNLEWLSGHFAKSPLADRVPLMLSIVTASELTAGTLSALGAVVLLITGNTGIALLGVCFSALSLLMLFFGQRMAKDYEGAAVLASYFTLALLALFVFAAG